MEFKHWKKLSDEVQEMKFEAKVLKLVEELKGLFRWKD